jgi:hypothetical protein
MLPEHVLSAQGMDARSQFMFFLEILLMICATFIIFKKPLCDRLAPYTVVKIASQNNKDITAGVQAVETGQGSSTAQTLDTTKISDDIEILETTLQRELSLPVSLLQSSLNVEMDSSIATFLKKPIAFYSNVLKTSDVYQSANLGPALGWNYPSSFLSLTPYANKLQGFMYFRGTIVLTMQVNATPFQQGYYILGHVPNAGGNPFATDWAAWFGAHTSSVVQRTQCPHAPIDLSTQTATQLRIPFVSSYNAWTIPTTNNVSNNGTVFLAPISALATSSSAEPQCSYTIWVHIEDLSLSVPIAPHGDFMPKKNTFNPASMPSVPKMPEFAEQKKKNIGPLTTALGVMSSVSFGAAMVPALTAVAAPAGWFLGLAAGVAGAFGWSKPHNADVQTTIVRDFMYASNTVDTADNSRSLALFDSNTVEVLPGFSGTDVDELAFDAFLPRPTIIGGVDWGYSNNSGDSLYEINLSPSYLSTTVTVGARPVTHHTPVSFLSNYFVYWRGDFKFTFKIIKTNLHSGRLAFVFSPYQSTTRTDYSTSYADSVYTWRDIVDIRTTNVVSFSVPFVSNSQYRPVTGVDAIMGTLKIFVVDKLISPDTCSPTITILGEVSAQPGFEFAVPRPAYQAPVYGIPVVTAPHASLYEGTNVCVPIGNAVTFLDHEHEAARKCIGEKVVSLRPLLRKFSPMAAISSVGSTSDVSTIYPFALNWVFWTSTVYTVPVYFGDILTAVSSCFALSRGGMRVKVVNPVTYNNPADQGDVATVWLDPVYGYSSTGNTFFSTGNTTSPSGFINRYRGANANLIYVQQQVRGGFEVQIPSYSPFNSRSNAFLVTWPGNPIGFDYNPNPIMTLNWSTTNDWTPAIMRAGSDDFNLGQFVSIPPMVILGGDI